MKVKVFDESHEKDLEESINNFLNIISSNIGPIIQVETIRI